MMISGVEVGRVSASMSVLPLPRYEYLVRSMKYATCTKLW